MFSHSTNTTSFFSFMAALIFSLSIAGVAAAQGNTSFGTGALQNNTTGSYNTASGFQALFSNTTGNYNTASGVNALVSNSIGEGNTANGVNVLLSNTTGFYNTASGFQALFSNTTGSFNAASGNNALRHNTTGSQNTAIGFQTLDSNTTGGFNTAIGLNALRHNTTGSQNTAIGFQALDSNTTGGGNTAIGDFTNVSAGNLTNATAIGSGATVNASNKIRLGHPSVTVIEGQVAFTAVSDKTQKENFQPVDGEEVLGKIRGLELSSWNFIGHDPKKFRHYGPMAQDFFVAFGHDGVGQIGSETTINSGDLAGILMIAVQALEKRTAELKQKEAQIAVLESKVEELRAKYAYFETVVARVEALELRKNHSIQITAD
jgi:trimeric autotransporter adhesin